MITGTGSWASGFVPPPMTQSTTHTPSTTPTPTPTSTTQTTTTTTTTTTITPPPQTTVVLETPSRPRPIDYGGYRPPRKRQRRDTIEEYFQPIGTDRVVQFCLDEWTEILTGIEIELDDVWTRCTIYRHNNRQEHVCIYYDDCDRVEGNHKNKGYTFDRNTKQLYDTDGDVIEYRRSVIL